MTASWWMRGPLVAALVAAAAGTGSAQTHSEPAYYGNHVLEGPGRSTEIEVYAGGSIDATTLGGGCVGMISDAPDVQVELRSAGAPLTISVATSEGVDLTLVVNTATGEWLCDDDGGEGLDSLLTIDDPATGAYDVWIGALDDGTEYSAAVLTIAQGAAAGATATATETAPAPAGLDWMKSGRLEAGDALVEGKFADSFPVAARVGEELVFDLRSSEFDTYLTLRAPSGATVTNDDYEGSTGRSLLSFVALEPGRHTVTATSYDEGETGAYTLSFARLAANGEPPRVERGTLGAGDTTRDGGRYADLYRFEGAPGRRAVIDLASPDFDTFLMLRSPSGFVIENDDAGTTDSRIDTSLTEFGTYEVTATSYDAGETGAYTLTIGVREPISTDGQAGRDTIELAIGDSAAGRLETTDLEFEPGRYQDIYAFSGTAGDLVRVTMSSTAVDTYLVVRVPGGGEFTNDDFDGSIERSVVDLKLPVTGRYQVVATSYGAGMTGAYDLALARGTGLPDTGRPRAGTGRVFGIFAGISDYSQLREVDAGWGDLDYTADDAVNIHRALMTHAGMQPGDAHILADRQATRANIEAAFRDIGARIGPDDAFVFFFSGHGGQVERPGGPDVLDADGHDETLALSDQEITDDEMRELFDGISARVAVIILDSCFSGGFAKDVVSAPGRMGMFSSDEDVTSLVAVKFEAGGYLSHFLAEALENGEADENGDGAIDAIELSQYLRFRYSQEAMVKAPSRFEAPDFTYQHLVVDRGGVSHDTVLFTLN